MTRSPSSNSVPASDQLWGSALLSAMLHAGALAAALFVWPNLAPPLVLPSDIVPVDLEIADETNVMPQEQAPEPVPEPEKPVEPDVPATEMSMAETPPPPAPEEPELAIEEKPEPPKPEPPPKPKPEKPKESKKREEFDIDRIASLVDKLDEKPPSADERAGIKPTASRTLKGAGAQTAMTASEIDAFKSQLSKCWKVDPGTPDPAALVFRLRIFLNQDGTVASAPELIDKGGLGDPYFRAAVDSAKRAVQMCSPFQLPPEKFETWNDITITFDPTRMAGY